MTRPVDQVRELFHSQSGPMVVVSPFIKRAALESILRSHPKDSPLTVYTRWNPLEVLLGVSDPTILHVVSNGYPDRQVFLAQRLHAKLYVRGKTALVGSANVTFPGLGLGGYRNTELLVPVPTSSPEVVALTDRLRHSAVLADSTIMQNVLDQAGELDATNRTSFAELAELYRDPLDDIADGSFPVLSIWMPRTSEPRRLFDVYAGTSTRIMETTKADAAYDLQELGLEPGLNQQEFRQAVASQICDTEAVHLFDVAITKGDPVEFLSQSLELEMREANVAFGILRNWALYFLTNRYRETTREGKTVIIRKSKL